MNFRIIVKTIGILLIFLSLMLALVLAIVHLFDDNKNLNDKKAIAIALATSVITGTVFIAICRKSTPDELQRRESIAIISLGWIFCALISSIPYMLSSNPLSFTHAFFESMSGLTTTGATILNDIENNSNSILLWRSLTQWIGGMGILVLFLAIFNYSGKGSKVLFKFESSAQHDSGVYSAVRHTALSLWILYLFYTLICFVGLKLLGMNLFDSLNHALTTLSTGGFSTKNNSIAHFSSPFIHIWIIIFMLIGSLNFLQFLKIKQIKLRKKTLFLEKASLIFLIVFFISTILISLNKFFFASEIPVNKNILDSAFQVSSIMSSSGFTTADYDSWPSFSKILIFSLMFMGGCAGSTAGGLKVNRFIATFKILHEQLTKTYRPYIVFGFYKKNAGIKLVRWQLDMLFLFVLAAFMWLSVAMLICIFEPNISMIGAISTSASCFFNIGPAFAEAGPMNNFSHLSSPTLTILILAMLIGRLEFLAALTIFLPRFWKSY